MAKSKIEWTESTWNPVTGCTKLSDGCANCYAHTMANRLFRMGNKKYRNAFQPTLHESCLPDPFHGGNHHLFLLILCPTCFTWTFL